MTTTSTTSTQTPNVHEMVVIHRVFRRELAAVPRLVRETPAGDTERARIVGDHVALVLETLHVHHTGEDELLWPLLLDRAAPSAELVHTMEDQHHRVEELIAGLDAALPGWVADPTTERAERLAALLEELRAALLDHLDLEEREILPVVARHLTIAEWNALGEHGKDHTPRKHLPLVFGAILEDADDGERAELLATVPAPIRFFLRTAGARQYRRYITRVRGA
jgi:hemerythrin-like domain-containing protein